MLVVLGLAAAFGLAGCSSGRPAAAAVVLEPVRSAVPPSPFRSRLPEEIRGVHVTMALMTLTGKLDEYLGLTRDGLNTIELDVKDENGNVAFVRGAPAIAVHDGAARAYYDPREVVRQAHAPGST